MKADSIAERRHPLSTLTGVRVPKLAFEIVLVFLAYFVAGKLGQATANIRSGNIGPVWPAFGVAIAAMLAYGTRVWPAVLLSAYMVNFHGPVSTVAAMGQAAGTTIASISAAVAMRRVSGFEPTLQSLRNVVAFLGWSFVGAFVSASIGTASLYLAGIEGYSGLLSAWLIYGLGDATGAWLITPLVFSVPGLLPFKSIERAFVFVGLMTAIVALCVVLFGGLPIAALEVRLMTFAVLPLVMWSAISFGIAGASLSVLLIATIATLTTALGAGPFIGATAQIGAIRLEIFFSVLACTGLTLGAMIAERDAAHVMAERLNLGRRLLEAQEEERQRIARELHDDISQRLSLVAIKLKRSPRLQEEVSEIASDVQALSHELHSSRIELLGIAAAMRNLCAEFAIQQKAAVDFESDNLPPIVRADASLCLYRILQEGLQNAAKHSGVLSFEVRLWAAAGEVHLTIGDRGVGFDVNAARLGRGIGLASMEERAKLVGGQLAISSRPSAGATIHAIVPLI